MSTPFQVLPDKFENPYYSIRAEDFENPPNLTDIRLGERNIASFLDPVFEADHRRTGPFTRDYTQRDDVLLAFLSLFLLLVIDAIVATILLRTKSGDISNFGFSIKVVLEYFRDFKLNRAFKPGRRAQNSGQPDSKLNIRLLGIAISLLIFIVGLEVGILFLTDPLLKRVSNDRLTFRIKQPMLPHWDDVRFHNRASINRPCVAIGLKGVEQGPTRLNGCVSSNISVSDFGFFEEVDDDINFIIVSKLHRFGADHQIFAGGLSATYTARAFFSLYDGETRMMEHAEKAEKESLHVEAVHQQYFAYLFSAYNLTVQKTTELFLDQLNELKFNFDSVSKEDQLILDIGGLEIRSAVTEYTTKVSGVLPRGVPALRLGHNFFKGTTAIVVAAPNETDLFLESGMLSVRTVVWEEKSRPINLLSLCIILIAAMLLLAALRVCLKPVTVADIAGMWVKKRVGADLKRSPLELDENEDEYFKVTRREEYTLEDSSVGRRSD